MRQTFGMSKVIALNGVASQVGKRCALLLCFDAFDDQPNVELACEVDSGFDDGVDHRVRDLLCKLFVEFDDVKRQGVQTAQAGLTGAKVVHGDAGASVTQLFQAFDMAFVEKLKTGFCDFKIKLWHSKG